MMEKDAPIVAPVLPQTETADAQGIIIIFPFMLLILLFLLLLPCIIFTGILEQPVDSKDDSQ